MPNREEMQNEIYGELSGYYHDYKPDDEDFLEENPELVEQMDELDSLNPSTVEETYNAIIQLHSFVSE